MKNSRGAWIALRTRGGRASRISWSGKIGTEVAEGRSGTLRRLATAALAAALLVALAPPTAGAADRPPQAGDVWAWGYNALGELGDGTTESRSIPGAAPALEGVVSVAAGTFSDNQDLPHGSHNLALGDQGTVWAWGRNTSGQLGDGTTDRRTEPKEVPGLSGVVAVAAGGDHSLALDDQGTVWAWGSNAFGELGNGTTGPGRECFPPYEAEASACHRPEPEQVRQLDHVVAIAAGRHHSLALRSDRTLWAWGWNVRGQLGDSTTADRSEPVQVLGLTDVTAIAGGGIHSLAVLADGTAWAWGHNTYGQLGDGTTTDSRLVPVQVSGLTDVTTIAGGAWHSLAVLADGTARAWGSNVYGQLGDGTRDSRRLPVAVSALNGVTTVAGGSSHSLAVLDDGTVLAWGWNGSGQLGDNSTGVRPEPRDVAGLRGVHAIAAGPSHSLALLDATVPEAPSNLTATPEWPPPAWAQGGARVELSWDAPDADGGRPVTGYRITREPDGVVTDVLADVTAETVTGLDYGETYTFTVAALNDRGAGPVAAAKVTPRSLPGTPTDVTATAGIESATIDFTVPPDGGSPFNAFTIRVCTWPFVCSLDGYQGAAVGSPWTPGETLTRTLSPLKCCQPHRFEVRFANEYGWGPWAVSNEVTPGEPASVTGLSRTVGFDPLTASAPKPRVELAWTKRGSPDAIDVTWTDGSTSRSVTLTPAPSAYTVTGLDHGKAYTFRVRAVAGGVESTPASASTSGSVMTSAVKPAAVTSGASIKLSGRLTRAGTTTGLGDQPVQLQIRTQDASREWSVWSNVGSPVRTTSTGTYAIAHRTPRNAQYRVLFTGVGSRLGSVSPMRAVNVAPRVTAALSTASMRLGSTTRLTGKVTPNLAAKIVHLQKRVGGRWVDVRGMSQRLTSTSTYRFSIKPGSRGTHTYRVRVPAYAPYVKGLSPRRTLTVS